MGAADSASGPDSQESSVREERQHEDRTESIVVIMRNLLIGALSALVAYGLHQMFKAMLLARKLNY